MEKLNIRVFRQIFADEVGRLKEVEVISRKSYLGFSLFSHTEEGSLKYTVSEYQTGFRAGEDYNEEDAWAEAKYYIKTIGKAGVKKKIKEALAKYGYANPVPSPQPETPAQIS